MTTIGVIHSGSNSPSNVARINTLLQALTWAGYTNGVGGLNVLPTNFAADSVATLNADALNLIRTTAVDVLVAAGGSAASAAALTANTTAPPTNTPVVFTSVANALSLSPSNMTGICARTTELDVDRLKLLHELLPSSAKFGLLYDVKRGDSPQQLARLIN